MAQTLSTAATVAAMLTKTLGRPITAKAVRSWAREHLAAYDKVKHPAYQGHLYDAATVAKITAGFKARSVNARVQAEAKAKATPKPSVKRDAKAAGGGTLRVRVKPQADAKPETPAGE
jgi:hypothetical protein